MHDIDAQLKGLGLEGLHIIYDGVFRGFKGEKYAFKGWYKAEKLTTRAGKILKKVLIGDWKSDERFYLEEGQGFTKKELSEISEQSELLEARLHQDLEEKHDLAKKQAASEWEKFNFGTTLPDYFIRKKLPLSPETANIKSDGQTALCPITTEYGELVGLQYIYYSGEKELLEGTPLKGAFYSVGLTHGNDPARIYITEGIATALSVFIATGEPVVAALAANNLKWAALSLRKLYPTTKLVIAADNDRQNPENTGLNYATEAAASVGGDVVYPKTHNDWNDLLIDKGDAEVKASLTEAKDPFLGPKARGFMKTIMRDGVQVKVPDYDKLIAYFDYLRPFVSLRETAQTYAWCGTHYVKVTEQELLMFATSQFKPSPSAAMMKEFRARIQAMKPVSVNWFNNTTEGFINFKNGVLDTKTGVFSPGHRVNRGFRSCLTYDYDPTAVSPMFDKMIENVCSGDSGKIENILRFLGYTVTGSPCYADKFLALTGIGSNGKSRFLNVVRALIGDDNTIDAGTSTIAKENQRPALDGKLLCIMEEVPSQQNKDVWEVIKNMASGGKIFADVKFKDAYAFKNTAKIIFTCNKLPQGTDPTDGWFRRFLLLPFDKKFSRADKDFIHNIDELIIKNELSGAFNRLWDAYQRLVKENYGFAESVSVNEALDEFRIESDNVLQWSIDAFLEKCDQEPTDPKDIIIQKELYRDYNTWCKDSGYKALGKKTFFNRLRQIAPFQIKKQRVGDKNEWVVTGFTYEKTPASH